MLFSFYFSMTSLSEVKFFNPQYFIPVDHRFHKCRFPEMYLNLYLVKIDRHANTITCMQIIINNNQQDYKRVKPTRLRTVKVSGLHTAHCVQ